MERMNFGEYIFSGIHTHVFCSVSQVSSRTYSAFYEHHPGPYRPEDLRVQLHALPERSTSHNECQSAQYGTYKAC